MWPGVAEADWGAALLALRLARGLDLAASLALFGTLLFWAAVAWPAAPAGDGGLLRERLVRLVRAALALNIAAAAAWLPVQAAGMGAGYTGDVRAFLHHVPFIAANTSFGQALILRTVLAAIAVVVAGGLQRRYRVAAAAAIAGASVALQARLGHALAADDPLLLASVALHVLAAGAWLGGLVPLALTIAAWPDAAARVARRFSWLGLVAVAVLLGTAIVQSPALVGDVGGWFGTAYGIVAQWKTLGLLLLLALALLNRFILTPKLAAGERGVRPFVISVTVETLVGLVVVALGVWLATLPPGAHILPEWPFSFQPDWSDIGAGHVRREIVKGLALLAVIAAGIVSLLWRPTRVLGPLAAAALVVWLPAPNWRLLAKPATQTSFYRSQTGFTTASIARGEELLRRHCTDACFRPFDDPSDPTPYNFWARSDGDLFGWMTSVFDVIGHSPFPHGTIARLDERDRWLLIDYFRARVAGTAVKRLDRWWYPVPAPEFSVTCAEGPRRLRDFRGRIVHVVASGDGAVARPPAAPEGIDVATLVIARRELAPEELAGGLCYTSSPDAWTALAIVSGLGEDDFAGARIHIDANGWLRSRIPPTETVDDETWRFEIADIAATPIETDRAGGHGH